MRLQVTLQIEHEVTIPLNYQYALSSAIYRFLETADADYAQFLHEEGYAPPLPEEAMHEAGDEPAPPHASRRRFKLFTFSLLWAQRSRVTGDRLHLAPGRVRWFVASPVEPFLTNFAAGLLTRGALQIGPKSFPVAEVQTLPAPAFAETTRFRCLSPIVAAVAENHHGALRTRYLRPDDPELSLRLRQNLLHKYAAWRGHPPSEDHFEIAFDQEYLASHRGTKLVSYKADIKIVGVFAPFTLRCSRDLMEFAYHAGLGEKNAAGFGMVEVKSER